MAKKKRNGLGVDEPLLHPDHPRPVTRRDFLRQGLVSGVGAVTGWSLFSMFANPRSAQAALSQDLQDIAAAAGCPVGGPAGGMVPFICFDLAGGANFAGSNVLVGGVDGQLDFLGTSGYAKLGLRGDEVPTRNDITNNLSFVDSSLGLAFHSNSALLAGILEKAGATAGFVNGAVIPARSENDTGNNPHNPMYGIARTGADGQIVTLIGSRNSDSGGNSMAPDYLIDPSIRPTKVDRPSDVTGMVDTGKLVGLLEKDDAVAVLESVARLSNAKLSHVSTGVPTREAIIKDLLRCGYISAADLADRFAGVPINPDDRNETSIAENEKIVSNAGGIFTEAEFDGDGEFRKTASVMKMVIDGYAGAGTVTMGGYDYHTGDRTTGEARDLRAGRCIGACLEYARRKNSPLMIYVLSDGSVFSNGMEDPGNGRLVWTGDNQQGAASFFLVYNPGGAPTVVGATPEEQARHQQIGYFRDSGDVETASSPAANNVNLLVETVVLNYLALHGAQGQFSTLFPNHGLGNATLQDRMIAFEPIV